MTLVRISRGSANNNFPLRLISVVVLLSTFAISQPSVSAELNSQAKEVYFLVGEPTPKSDSAFPSILYIVKEDVRELQLVRKITDIGSYFIHPYNEERLVSIREVFEKPVQDEWKNGIDIIDMNSPTKEQKCIATYPKEMSFIQAHLFSIPQKGLYQSIVLAGTVGEKFESRLIGLNLADCKQEDLPWDYYKYVRVSGVPGGEVPGGDTISLYPSDNNKLIFKIGGREIESSWILPNSMKFSKDDRIILYINNDAMSVFASIKTRVKTSKGLGHTTFHVLNKADQTWTSLKIEGGKSGVRGFGSWLAGHVSELEHEVASPGKAKRRQKISSTGTPVDWRFKDRKIYSPGTLFIFNIQKKEKYTIETGQGDSEVLLVEGDTVFYRVNDEIYQAKMTKNKIAPGTIVVKDDIVYDIHWAFMGPQ